MTGIGRLAWLWAPAVAYMGVIFYLSSLSSPPVPPHVSDKILHAGSYVLLAILLVRALAGGLPARIPASVLVLAVVLTTLYGASDEIHQMFVPLRTPSLLDLLADAIGGAIGASLCWAWSIIPGSRAYDL